MAHSCSAAVAPFYSALDRKNFIFYIRYNLYKYYIMQARNTRQLDTAFTALSDPTRRAILARLVIGEATVLELGRPFKMSQPAISQHIKVLERAGLITRRVDGTKRPCRLSKPGFDSIDQWLARMRKAFEKNYDRLDHVLAEMKSTNGEETR
jgi:DNA-binding transcriptional ArsR family regulator